MSEATDRPHRRYNPLTGEYVLVSPHRMNRPWQGQVESTSTEQPVKYDSTCYLCPGNTRVGGKSNPQYSGTFRNDFPALLARSDAVSPNQLHPLLKQEEVHAIGEIVEVIKQWATVYEHRSKEPGIVHVQIFENKGSAMGCSNPHPHCQVWSSSTIPTIIATEFTHLRQYAQGLTDGCAADLLPLSEVSLQGISHAHMLLDYANFEIHGISLDQGRVVLKNEHWVAIVPWWATWPFELLVLPYHRQIQSISDLDDAEILAFAHVLSEVTKRYDALFGTSFPYSMGIHQRPVGGATKMQKEQDEYSQSHLHLHFYPPLLRSATVRKFLVGYEMMAESQRDLTAEQAAQRLRMCGSGLAEKIVTDIKG